MKRLLLVVLFATLGLTSAIEARCHSAYVVGLDPYGDNFLAVREGPSTRYRQYDSLYNGNRVFVCDYRGSWRFVNYGRGCYLDYGQPRGRCRSGWVHGGYLR
ncbi:MAG: SH3 domain-containing protein [Campylobacterales bacterium]|nr:SH3 domain-containing protein [Campylobacterales bacterium]